jgi:TonB family protein
MALMAAIASLFFTASMFAQVGPDDIFTVGGDVTAPVVIRSVEAGYTEEARAAGISGIVQLECVIRKDGTGKASVRRVVRSLGHGLDENARTALERCRFSPATKNGRSVSVLMEADFQFDLQ